MEAKFEHSKNKKNCGYEGIEVLERLCKIIGLQCLSKFKDGSEIWQKKGLKGAQKQDTRVQHNYERL